MINKENLSEYDGGVLDIFTPTVNGWSNGMQIPSQKALPPQKIIFTEGSLNFKQVSVPAGFVYHKISIQKNNAFVYNNIVHTSIKLTNNDSFIYADTLTEYNDDGLVFPGRNISEVGITYVMYPHIVLRLEFLNKYKTYNKNVSGTTIYNGGIDFKIENDNAFNAVLVEIFIELDIRNLLKKSINYFFNYNNKLPSDTTWKDVYQIYEFIRSCIIETSDNKETPDEKGPIQLFSKPLNDILSLSLSNIPYVNFIGANITKYNCSKQDNNTINYKKQENTENTFTSKDTFLDELNKTGTPGDGNVFYNEDNKVVNIYNDFHKNEKTYYNFRGVFNYRDITNELDDNETMDSYWINNEVADDINFLEATSLSLMRCYELFDKNMFVKHDVNDLSSTTYQSLINKLQKLTTAENDILWGKGANFIDNNNTVVSANTFKKNKILLKVRK